MSGPNLMQTGPVLITGLGRGVRDAVAQGRNRRHRAGADGAGITADGAPGRLPQDTAESDSQESVDRAPAEWAAEEQKADAGGPTGTAAPEQKRPGRWRPLAAWFASPAPRFQRALGRPVSDHGVLTRRVAGFVLLAALALAGTALVFAVIAQNRTDARIATDQAQRYTPPALPSVAAIRGQVTLIGDGTVNVAAPSVGASRHWTALTANRLSVSITTIVSPDSGYLTGGTAKRTFLQAAQVVPVDSDIVVLFGGASDAGRSPLAVAKAVTRSVAEVHSRAPGATIVIVGPVISGTASTSELQSLRALLKNSAKTTDARWADPIGSDWLDEETLAAADATALTVSDERAIAARMSSLLAPFVP